MHRRDIFLTLAAALAGSHVAFGAGSSGKVNPSVLMLWSDADGGERLEVRGRVVDGSGKPLAGAEVFVRHAGPDGGYSQQYQGVMVTDESGTYTLRTTVPGTYGRPRHIHVQAAHPSAGYKFTEIVFRGDPLLDEASQPNGIILETVRVGDTEVLVGTFNITIDG